MKRFFTFGFYLCCLLLAASFALQAQTIYLTPSGGGNLSGSSWDNAAPGSQLQSKISSADSGAQLWIAKGTYQPATNTSYSMKEGVKMYGGFDSGATSLSQRNFTTNPTILKGNGSSVISNDNGLSASAVLDGFTITGGNATSGGGMFNLDNSSPTVTNCTFFANTANTGGGMYNLSNSSPTVTNCTFSANAANTGGGMYNFANSSPTVTNCIFSANTVSHEGGGMFNYANSSPTVTNCTFSANTTNFDGGGMYNDFYSSPTVTNCTFSANLAIDGGGMYNDFYCSPTVTNCTFSANLASGNGGGMYNYMESSPTVVTNCIFWGNTAAVGPAIYNSDFTATIFTTVTYSTVQGGYSGNLDTDPLFMNDADPDGPDNIFGTADDGLKLKPASPAVNSGNNAAVPAGVTTDITGAARIQGDSVDRGAYESPYLSNSITTAVAATSACSGTPIAVTYTAMGMYAAGNTFTAQLSDAAGSFASPVAIGSVTATADSTINATIPAGTTAGTGYRIRVVSSTPAVTGTDNGTDITLNALPATPTVSVTQPTCTTATGTITVNSPIGSGITYSIDSTNYLTNTTFSSVMPGSYRVTVKNSSGCLSAATPATINPQPATPTKPTITANGPTTFCPGSSVILSAPASTSYLWSNNATTQSITVTQSGAYSVKVTNGSGCTSPTSDVTTVTVNPLPAPPAISNATAYQGTAPVILTAANCSGTLVWTNPNGTTGSGSQISVPTTTPGSYTYQVACKGTSCTSTYTPVTVTILSTLISVSHLDGDNNQPVNNIIKPYLQLNNESNTAIPYRDLSVRYWLTAENYAPFTNLSVYYAQLGSSSVSMKYVKTTARQGAFGYIEYTFNAAAGNLPANTNSGPIQTGVGKQDWSMFNEADDYSFAPNTAYTKTGKITIYRNGSLIWGTEPSPVAPVTSLATYAQNQNSATNTNTISTYLKVNNEGNQPVAYKDITVRYWFTTDGSSPLNYTLDYAQLGSNNVTGSFIKLPTALPKADTYLQLSFPNLTDSLYPISSTGNIQQRINKQDWSAFNETNDHSYKAAGPMAQNATITIYIKGQLVFGTEPTAQSMARSSTESTTQPAMVSAVKGTTETAAKELSVKVLQNPLEGNELQFIITGAKGQSLKVQLVDATGRLMTEKEIRNAGATEFQQLPVADNASQLIYLRVSMGNVFKVVKVVKAHASVNK